MTEHLDDKELLMQFRDAATKERSFTLILKKYQEKLYWHIRRMVVNHEDANDVLQNMFIKVWKALDNFREDSQLYTWLYRIAANAIADQARKKSRETLEAEDTTNTSVDPDLEQVERRAQLFRAVEALPEDQRKVILLRFGEEKSIREIAVDLNRSEGAVKQLQFRGLENLRARLRE